MSMIITVSFNTRANAQKCYHYLRNRSILSKHYHRGRGDHCLHIYIPKNFTAESMESYLKTAGFEFFYMGED